MDEKLEGKSFKDIFKAVRFSMSIPIFFSFKSYKDHILFDGAILLEDSIFNDWAGGGTPIICFRLKSDQVTNKPLKKSWLPLVQYLMILSRVFITNMPREYLHDQYLKNTIIVNTGKFSPDDFNMSIHYKETLYAIGYKTALEFIPKRLNSVETVITENELKFTDPKV